MERTRAENILREFVTSESLIRHCMAVEAAMRHYARLYGADEHLWGVTGLLHDFDYEKFPDPPQHTREGARILCERGVDPEIVGAILSHAPWNLDDYPRDRPLRRVLFAVDELCGFIYAVALMRPQKIGNMTASSVRKKLKQPSFAASVSRDDIMEGANLIETELTEHIEHCIAALQCEAIALGIASPSQS